MNKTINQLDEIESLATSDELAIWDNSASETKKVPASEIKSLVITATSTTVTGAKLMAGSVVKILFTSAITGSDTTTGLSISYNGTSIPVKVGKNGSLADFVASDISGTYTYLQAYTTLELAFDGTQFIIIGNPVVISSADYTIYADGEIVYQNIYTNTEKKMNKKWFGADVYVRVFKDVALSAGNVIVVDNFDTSKIINLYGYAIAGSTYVNLNRGSDQLEVYAQNNQIIIYTTGYNVFSAVVIVEYTK